MKIFTLNNDNNENSNLVKRKTIYKNISDSYCTITKSEIGVSNMYILDVNIEMTPAYGYQFVTGHAFDTSGNLFVYFSGLFNANNVQIMIHYSKI